MSIETNTSANTPSVAGAPFDNREADVIIRTSNNVDFYVFKRILSEASPVFYTTFTLPQAPHAQNASTSYPQVVDVAEDDATWDTLLRVCYPTPNPVFDLNTAKEVLEAGKKYDMEVVVWYCRDGINRVVSEDPLLCFNLAYCSGFEAEARAAAKASLHQSLQDLLHTSSRRGHYATSGPALTVLLLYHSKSQDAALNAINAWSTHRSSPAINGMDFVWYTNPWAHEFMASVAASYQNTPVGGSRLIETSADMMDAFLCNGGKSCSRCIAYIRCHIPTFLEALREAVYQKQSEVAVDLSAMPRFR
ncbi:hypothetical protein EIP91_011889 [Steccherinum ochraceum]|uniref:BTB domain-containing protein n=1 Tax=Steccherinum ochraceum TaxID=92696 RepID=A0A4V2MWW6_9APHY|nr:hypothetical protein EIP91_011889 [Steccherinum ochraceum]